MSKTAFKVGDQVTFNGGFLGTVIELYSPGMIVVRGERGTVCIPVEDAQLREGRAEGVREKYLALLTKVANETCNHGPQPICAREIAQALLANIKKGA